MENKKSGGLIAIILSVVGVPFLVTLIKFFKKGADAPVVMSDLMAIFGLQVLIATLIMIYLKFFHHSLAVLG